MIKFEDTTPNSKIWGDKRNGNSLAPRDMEWYWSGTLLSHNCHGEPKPNTNWSHTSRFETPLKCWGCGKDVPTNIELEYRCLMERFRK